MAESTLIQPPLVDQTTTNTQEEEFESFEDSFEEDDIYLGYQTEKCLLLEKRFVHQFQKATQDSRRPTRKNKKPKITRFYVSVRAHKQEQERLLARPEPRAIPEFIPRYAPAPPAPAPPAPTPSVYTPPPPPVAQKEVSSSYEKELQAAISASLNQSHESGLSYSQLNDLLNRDLTPEDYELLLLLDSTVSKKTTEATIVDSLHRFSADHSHTAEGSDPCAICFSPYETEDNCTRLPCSHFFHTDCVGIWLREHSQSCPMCSCPVG